MIIGDIVNWIEKLDLYSLQIVTFIVTFMDGISWLTHESVSLEQWSKSGSAYIYSKSNLYLFIHSLYLEEHNAKPLLLLS